MTNQYMIDLTQWFNQSYVGYNRYDGDYAGPVTLQQWYNFYDTTLIHIPAHARPNREEWVQSVAQTSKITNTQNGNSNLNWSNSTTNDMIITGNGQDRIRAGSGDDLIVAGDSKIFFVSAGQTDIVWAGDGNDIVFGGNNNDDLYGGNGDDILFGDAQLKLEVNGFNPQLSSQHILQEDRQFDIGGTENDHDDQQVYIAWNDEKGNDQLFGGNGNDILMGGRGSDKLYGGNGNDIIDAGPRGESGHDKAWGGAGNDIFYLGVGRNSQIEHDGLEEGLTIQILKVLKAFNESRLQNTVDVDAAFANGIDSEALTNFAIDMGLAIGSDAIGHFVPLGGTVTELISQSIDWIRNWDGSDDDMIEIMDFNPSQDLLALPIFEGADLRYESIPSAGGRGVTLEIKYAVNGREVTFAKVHIDQRWMAQFDTDATNVDFVEAVWDDLFKAGINLDLASNNPINLDEDGFYQPSANDGAYLRLIGNTGPVVRAGQLGDDNDVMIGGSHGDRLMAHDGYILPGHETDTDLAVSLSNKPMNMFGLGGNDRMFGSSYSDKIFGGNGDDEIYSFGTEGERAEVIKGGHGDDKVFAGAAVDTYNNFDGGRGHDILSFEYRWGGIDLQVYDREIRGIENGDSTEATALRATSIYDNFEEIIGSGFGDSFDFEGLRDRVLARGEDGDDLIVGARSDDQLFGGDGDDSINGGDGRDKLVGGDGNDILVGGDARDDLFGGAGDDVLDAGEGRHQQLTGGDGMDTFVFTEGNRSKDQIMDFSSEEGDRIEINFAEGSSERYDIEFRDDHASIRFGDHGDKIFVFGTGLETLEDLF